MRKVLVNERNKLLIQNLIIAYEEVTGKKIREDWQKYKYLFGRRKSKKSRRKSRKSRRKSRKSRR